MLKCYQVARGTPAIADVSCNMDILLMPDTEKSRPNLPVKYIIYMFSDICSESKELAIYSVENCLKEISFPWIFTIKKIKQLKTNRKKKFNFLLVRKKPLNGCACNVVFFHTSELFLWSGKYGFLPKICHK